MAARSSLQQIFSVISSNGLSKCTGEALQDFGPSAPQWVKANPLLTEVSQGGRERFGGLKVRGLQDPSQHRRLPKDNNGKGYSRPTSSTREWRRAAPVDDVGKHLQNASTAREAVSILKNHLHQSIAIDSYMYVDVLQRCFNQNDLASAKQVHDCIVQSEMEQNPYVANNLLRVYIRCGRLQDARQVFDKLVKKTVVTWNSMIGGYAEYYRASDAIEVYNQMRQEGGLPNEITFLNILKACASPVYLKRGKEIHAQIRHDGFQSDVRVGSALVHMYVKCSSIDDARLVFDAMVDRNVISWNVMIGGLAKHGRGHEASSLFLQMQREGFTPNASTYVSILSSSANNGSLDWVKEVHRHVMRAGLDSNLRVASALVHMYAKSGSVEDARALFNKMRQRDLISWNVMISGLAQHGYGYEAFSLFLQMQREGFHPDATTYLSILNASASAGALEWVVEIHSHAAKAGLASDVRLSNALIHMYSKIGSIRDAQLVFDQMKHRDIITWNAMIGGLAQDGCGQEALQLFGEMKSEGLKPDGCSFLAVLSACSHAGLVDEGRCQFLSMTQDFGIEPELEHYNCMVDMLGRAGHVEDAERFILNMPLEPDEVTWGAFLGACRTFSNVEMGEVAAKERIKLKPLEASTYVLLSNIYAAAGKWGHVSLMRHMMQERGIRKEPG